MIIQLTGLPGAGKTTLSQIVKEQLIKLGKSVEVLDGDLLRKTMNNDLGFSKSDRKENIRRLGSLAYSLLRVNEIVIIAAINPFEEIRNELEVKYGAKTIWIYCPIETLIQRDPKGLYRKALLPNDHKEKIYNLTGINDVYEEPLSADLVIDTEKNSVEAASNSLLQFIVERTQ